jgi:hypothetical protein
MRLLLAVVLSCLAMPLAQAETAIRVGWCASTISAVEPGSS